MRKPTRGPWRVLLWIAAGLVAALAIWLAPALAFHFLPPAWTGEPHRLAAALGIDRGSVVAEIGAGSGWLAIELARRAAPAVVYATEITAEKRREIAALAEARGIANIEVLEAGERLPGLPAGCCDAIVMRNVLHHIDGWPAYAGGLAAALKPGGRVGIIDFSPGAFFHISGDHGAAPADVVAAFATAGLVPEHRIDDWGGRMYLIVFRRGPGIVGRAGVWSHQVVSATAHRTPYQ